MRIAVVNAFAGREVAETELARRLVTAASALGWEAREVGTSTEVRRMDPDAALALHFFTPKLTPHPTYGCMWNPPSFFESDPRHVRAVLTYDGYLSSSPLLTRWVQDRLAGSPKRYFVTPFFASCNRTPYRPPRLERPRLFYAGTNWEGARLRELFVRLDRERFMDVHGPRDRWPHLRRSYRGPLPFDGRSVVEALHRAGVGLCLHREEHRLAGTPSLRIFEIAASGAVAICQDHPFVREAFGDTVLYLDPALDPAAMALRIAEHVRWIEAHRDEALRMSREAHAIFSARFALEELLPALEREHRALCVSKGFARGAPAPRSASPRVEYVVRAGSRSAATLRRALSSLAAQTTGEVGAVVVRHGEVDVRAAAGAAGALPVRVIEAGAGPRSTHLWQGLAAIRAPYFGILDDDDALHPNHVASLLGILDARPEVGVAYSGSIRVWEAAPGATTPETAAPAEPADLLYADPFDRARLFALENYITSNAFVARSDLLARLPPDPRLHLLEDLFLLLALSLHTDFVFSHEATSEFYWRAHRADNSVLAQRGDWTATQGELSRAVWDGALLPPEASPEARAAYRAALRALGLRMAGEVQRWREECSRRDEVIAHMEGSKLWRTIVRLRHGRDRLRDAAARIVATATRGRLRLGASGRDASPGSDAGAPRRAPTAPASGHPHRIEDGRG